MTGQGPWEGHRGAVHARGDSPVETPGSQAREGVCASEMSVVLQFGVHKLTWLKIVQNIQSTREGVTAFLKKKGPDFFYSIKLPTQWILRRRCGMTGMQWGLSIPCTSGIFPDWGVWGLGGEWQW